MERYKKVKSGYDGIVEAIEEKQVHCKKTGHFHWHPQKYGESITEFDAGMWGSMDVYIIIDKDKNIIVTFKEGVEEEL